MLWLCSDLFRVYCLQQWCWYACQEHAAFSSLLPHQRAPAAIITHDHTRGVHVTVCASRETVGKHFIDNVQ